MQLFHGIFEKNILILRSFKIENRLFKKPKYFAKEFIDTLKIQIGDIKVCVFFYNLLPLIGLKCMNNTCA